MLVIVLLTVGKRWVFDLFSIPYDHQPPAWYKYGIGDWVSIATLLQAFRVDHLPLDQKFGTFNVVYWSLAIEIQFYAVMALAIVSKVVYRPWLIGVTVLGIAASTFLPELNFNHGFFLNQWPIFALGVALFSLRNGHHDLAAWLPVKTGLPISVVLTLGTASLVVYLLLFVRPVQSMLFACLFALMLWVAIPLDDYFQKTRLTHSSILGTTLTWFASLGAMSYSIYLLHYNMHKIPRMMLDRLVQEGTLLHTLLLITTVCLMCWPFYVVFERPFLSQSSQRN